MQGAKHLLNLGSAQEQLAVLLADPLHSHHLQVLPALQQLSQALVLLMLESLMRMELRIKREQLLDGQILLDRGSKTLQVIICLLAYLIEAIL